MRNPILLASITLTMATACSGASNSSQSGSYGGSTAGLEAGGGTSAANVGGSLADAATGTGGTASGGALHAAGGSSQAGNTSTISLSNTGGQPSSGGDASTGGSVTTGGNAASGGVLPTGGRVSSGGTSSTGGILATGGKLATGGAAATGGKSGTAAGGKSAPTGGTSSVTSSACTREMLQGLVDTYMTAIQAGDSSLVSAATYKENGASVAFGSGLWATPLKVDQLPPLTALDVDRCEAYVEVIVNNNHEYVFGARLTASASSGQLSAISVIATDCDDWGFNAATYLQYSKAEQQSGGWGEVPAADRLSRQELQDAGYAYFAYWGDESVSVPWGTPCSRLEGGMYTGANGTCNVGIPDQGFAPQPTGALIDVDRGMAVVFVNLPGPDSHWFRVNKSGLRYIHTLTVCYVNGVWQCPGAQPTCS